MKERRMTVATAQGMHAPEFDFNIEDEPKMTSLTRLSR